MRQFIADFAHNVSIFGFFTGTLLLFCVILLSVIVNVPILTILKFGLLALIANFVVTTLWIIVSEKE